MFQDWEHIQELSPKDAAEIIFETFHKCRPKDELESMALYSEHMVEVMIMIMMMIIMIMIMVEVGQYLKKKLADRAEKNGRQVENNLSLYIRLYVCESVCLRALVI